MSRDRLKEFLNGFGGRVVLMVASGLSALCMAVGAWFAIEVWNTQKEIRRDMRELSDRLAMLSGDKISRTEFEAKAEVQRAEVRASLADLKRSVDHMNDLLLSRAKAREGEE